MTEYATKQDVQEIIDKLTGKMGNMFADLINHMDGRFEKLEVRMDRIERNQEKQATTISRHTVEISDLQDDVTLNAHRNDSFEKQLARFRKSTQLE